MLKIIFQKFKEYLATRKSELQPIRIRAKKIKRRTRLQFRINLFETISAWATEKKEQNKNKLYSDEDSDYIHDWFYSEEQSLGDKIGETLNDDGITFTFQPFKKVESAAEDTKNVFDDLAESVRDSIHRKYPEVFRNEPEDNSASELIHDVKNVTPTVMNGNIAQVVFDDFPESVSERIHDTIETQYQKEISDETLDYIQKETDVSVLKMLHEETEDPEIQKVITNRIKEVVNEKKNKRRVQRPKRKASVPLQSAQSAV